MCPYLLVFVGSELVDSTVYEQLANEYNFIRDMRWQLYLARPIQVMTWVKYYNYY